MREIKFRGKRIDSGEWLYGDLMHVNEQVLIKPIFTEPYEYDEDFDTNVDPKTVGQSTGLKDKNGKEIYEGDLLQDGKGVGEVKWVQEHCAFLIRTLNPHMYHYLESDERLTESEVIGNIYTNPELLEETP